MFCLLLDIQKIMIYDNSMEIVGLEKQIDAYILNRLAGGQSTGKDLMDGLNSFLNYYALSLRTVFSRLNALVGRGVVLCDGKEDSPEDSVYTIAPDVEPPIFCLDDNVLDDMLTADIPVIDSPALFYPDVYVSSDNDRFVLHYHEEMPILPAKVPLAQEVASEVDVQHEEDIEEPAEDVQHEEDIEEPEGDQHVAEAEVPFEDESPAEVNEQSTVENSQDIEDSIEAEITTDSDDSDEDSLDVSEADAEVIAEEVTVESQSTAATEAYEETPSAVLLMEEDADEEVLTEETTPVLHENIELEAESEEEAVPDTSVAEPLPAVEPIPPQPIVESIEEKVTEAAPVEVKEPTIIPNPSTISVRRTPPPVRILPVIGAEYAMPDEVTRITPAPSPAPSIMEPPKSVDPEADSKRFEAMLRLGLIDENGTILPPSSKPTPKKEVAMPEPAPMPVYSPVPMPRSELEEYLADQEKEHRYTFKSMLLSVFHDAPSVSTEDADSVVEVPPSSSFSELREDMRKKGYKLSQYVYQSTYQYYSQKYINVNGLRFATSLITYFLSLVLVVLGYFLADPIAKLDWSFYVVVAACLTLVPAYYGIRYALYRDRHAPANFSFKLAIVTSLMTWLVLMLIVLLIAFFVPSVGANISQVGTLVAPIFYPAVMLFCLLPGSACIYSLLYKSKRFHVR